MLMRIVWPIEDHEAGVLDLIAQGWDDFDNVIHRCGFTIGGSPKDWEVVPGSRFADDPEFKTLAGAARVLTCVVRVAAAMQEAA